MAPILRQSAQVGRAAPAEVGLAGRAGQAGQAGRI